jgi:hypothetical protein
MFHTVAAPQSGWGNRGDDDLFHLDFQIIEGLVIGTGGFAKHHEPGLDMRAVRTLAQESR